MRASILAVTFSVATRGWTAGRGSGHGRGRGRGRGRRDGRRGWALRRRCGLRPIRVAQPRHHCGEDPEGEGDADPDQPAPMIGRIWLRRRRIGVAVHRKTPGVSESDHDIAAGDRSVFLCSRLLDEFAFVQITASRVSERRPARDRIQGSIRHAAPAESRGARGRFRAAPDPCSVSAVRGESVRGRAGPAAFRRRLIVVAERQQVTLGVLEPHHPCA